ncbi:MAG: hypothetical protein GF411_19435 [Candidatus Lokiarchaeota archaeon]|nr:hypothetical protein [Candidatus Lokiarchaeota archaeon]
MSIEFQQTASLVIITNKILDNVPVDYGSDHSTIQFVKFIQPPKGAPKDMVYDDRKLIAQNPMKWLQFLKGKGVTHLRLHYVASMNQLPDRLKGISQQNLGEWLIEAHHEESSDVYQIGRNIAGSRFLGFHLLMLTEDGPIIPHTSLSVDIAYEGLRLTLEKLVDFTERFEYTENWLEIFQNALDVLEGREHMSFDGLFPPEILDEKSRNLLSGAFCCRVFGGMGSWNDLAFPEKDQKTYETLSSVLYESMHEAIEAAVNSTCQ